MTLNRTTVGAYLKDFDFCGLFIEELGWNRHAQRLTVRVDGQDFALQSVAQKCGLVVFTCSPGPDGAIPDYPTRRKIERQVQKSVHEHLVIYTDAGRTTQVWQWVKREVGKPTACRDHTYRCGQSGEALIQKLESLAVTLDEEESLTILDVTGRARKAFDTEKVTKRFYDRFQKEHAAFLQFVEGIPEAADREWYASVMLNRLMFVYFVQRKGFLDGDTDYLRNRLARMRAEYGKDKFHSFYRYFLLRLFHEGLGGKTRTPDLEKLLGRIPYLNGGLFDVHELERPDRYGKDIQIPDQAFERIFDYFDQYQWHLDERPLRADNEINPDVLGYIFEKYVNQKQMGAYYTKEDITEYISKNTVLPFILDAARAKCRIAFENPGGPTVWDLLKADPDRYIYKPVRHGLTWDYRPDLPAKGEPLEAPRELPDEIAVGLSPPTLHQPVGEVASVNDIETIRLRKDWNKPAPPSHGLPTETWREVVARRKRYQEVRAKLAAGEVRDPNDLITLNLDIRQFVQDVIENCEGPDLLRALWQSIERVSILDPTCGSGAFLFAALGILEPLYEACLDRMEAFVSDADRGRKTRRFDDLGDLREVLARVDAHPNRRYFIFKSIILNNLYGVDIMEEAVEICKLRLFLKLAAQVQPDPSADNLGMEPLPDIDFNIRAGNTLVGFATLGEVRAALKRKWTGDDYYEQTLKRIEAAASAISGLSDQFRERQVGGRGECGTAALGCSPGSGGGSPAEGQPGAAVPHQRPRRAGSAASSEHVLKQSLGAHLKALDDQLNRYLAGEYGINADDPKEQAAYEKWLKSHQPFHWFVEFHRIMNAGGFDVIIGNPPYVSSAKVRKAYEVRNLRTERCTDIYAWCLDRVSQLASETARTGMIVPLSLSFSGDFASLRSLLYSAYGANWFSSFGRIPAALFAHDVRVRNTIHVGARRGAGTHFTTRLHRWFDVEREHLLARMSYARFQPERWSGRIPKLDSQPLVNAFEAALAARKRLGHSLSDRPTKHVLHFKKTAYNWLNFCRKTPPCLDEDGESIPHTEFGDVAFLSAGQAATALLLLNGKLELAFWAAIGDDFHLTRWMYAEFPADLEALSATLSPALSEIARRLETAMVEATSFKLNAKKRVGNYNLARCRSVTDESDRILARALGFENAWEDLELLYAQLVRTDFGADADEGEAGE